MILLSLSVCITRAVSVFNFALHYGLLLCLFRINLFLMRLYFFILLSLFSLFCPWKDVPYQLLQFPLSSLLCISFFLPTVLLMWFASVVYSFLLSFRSCVLLVLVGVGYIYACIAGMIITDEVTAKRFESWNFS